MEGDEGDVEAPIGTPHADYGYTVMAKARQMLARASSMRVRGQSLLRRMMPPA
jgi:hypothetical protein